MSLVVVSVDFLRPLSPILHPQFAMAAWIDGFGAKTAQHSIFGGSGKLRVHTVLNSYRLQICLLAMLAALLGDLAPLFWPALPRFWAQFLSDFDYVAIVLGGVSFGSTGGLITAAVAGGSHSAIQQFGFHQPFIAQGELTVFVLVGLLAGSFAEGRSSRSAPRPPTGVSLESTGQLQIALADRDIAPGLVHQLRTPLASIEGAAYMLEDNALPEDKRRDLMGIIAKECQRLDLLIGLLDSNQPRRPEPTAVELGSLLGAAAERALEALRRPDVSIERRIAPDLPHLHLDREAVEEAIVNVLLDAIKATPEGGRVTVSCHPRYDEVFVQVQDKRPQASAVRLYRALSSAPMGSWPEIDLAIAQRILVRQGGALRIEQNVDSGLTFTLVLPKASGACI